jgi:uncharacterized protein (TIGR03067 family)
VLKAMFLTKLKIATVMLVGVLALGIGGFGMGLFRHSQLAAAQGHEHKSSPETLPGKETSRPKTDQELAKFEGTWVLVSSERNGQATFEEKNPYKLTFMGDKWKVHRGDEVAVEGTVRLVDVAATPRKFDLIKPPHLAPVTTVDYGIY